MENPENVEPTDNPGVKRKKPKLTKEEKKARKLENKRLKAITKIAKDKQLIRDQLQRELKYSKKNYEKVTRDWLKFINGLKSTELKKGLEVSSCLFWNIYDELVVKSEFLLFRKHGLISNTFLILRIIISK